MPFRPNHQKQLMLLPPDLEAMVPEKDLARVVDRFVESLPAQTVEGRLWRRRGRPSYRPGAMLKMLLYAYSQRTYSCRRIAKACRENVKYLWLTGMEQPDFNTVNRFRSEYLRESLEEVFGLLMELLLEQGYVRGRDYFVDGTQVEAEAGKYTAVWRRSVERHSARVRERARAILEEAERINRQEDEEYGERDLEERGEESELTAEAVEEAARRLGRELQERRRGKGGLAERLKGEAEKLRRYEEQRERLGDRNSYSKTDPDATFLRMKNGELRAGYNVQLGTENGFIVGYSVSQSPNDAAALAGHLEARGELGLEGEPQRLVADAGYGSEEVYEELRRRGIEGHVKYRGWEREASGRVKAFEKAAFGYDEERDEYVCPAGRRLVRIGEQEKRRRSGYVSQQVQYGCADCGGCAWKAQCTQGEGRRTVTRLPNLERHQAEARARLASEPGRELSRRRAWETETRFAVLKRNLGFRRFHLRGLVKTTLEMGYLAIAMNLMWLNSPKAAPI